MPEYLVKLNEKNVLRVFRYRGREITGCLKITARDRKEAIEKYRDVLEAERQKAGSTVSQTSKVKTVSLDLDKSILNHETPIPNAA